MTRLRLMFCLLLAGSAALQSSATAQGTLDRTVRPNLGPTPEVRLPKIQKAELPNGLKVWLVEAHKVPIVALNLVLSAGSEREALATPGMASMTAAMIQEGTPTRTSLQIADEIDAIGAMMNVYSQTDFAGASLNCLTKHLDAALAVFGDVLTHPTMPEKEFARVKNDRLTSLLQQKDRPTTIASMAFGKILYGSAHPYGNDVSGTEQSIKDLTRNDLVKFYQTYYRPNNATLVVVGDVSMESMLPRLTKAFSDWKKGDVPETGMFVTPAVETRKVYLVDKPGAPQSEIRIGYPALARSTPDFFSVNLMNMILGGQFSSRLNSNIRERRGFSYGVRSMFQFDRLPGPFIASGGVQTAKTDSALQEFLREIDLMREKGISAEELEFAKNRTQGTFVAGFETPAQIAGGLVNIVVYNLPDDYFANYLKNFGAVTLADVQRVAKLYLDSSKMTIVVVGDVKTIRPGIEQMKFAPVVVADVNGKPADN
jgi:predicted Zn-dependent peptidase